MEQLISNVIFSATQAVVPLFHQVVNTLLIEVLWLRLEPILNIIHDFTVRVKMATEKTTTTKNGFSANQKCESYGDRSGLHKVDVPTLSTKNSSMFSV